MTSRIFDARCPIDCTSHLSAGACEFRHYLEPRQCAMYFSVTGAGRVMAESFD
jgi:hypothetical protein